MSISKSLQLEKWVIFFLACACSSKPAADQPASTPGWTYIQELEHLSRIDLLPEYRTHTSVAQVSSYDTTGGNDDGFSGKYSFIRKEEEGFVIADLKGPGVINRIWTPTPTNDTLKFYFDGERTPRIRICFKDLFQGTIFPFLSPVCGNELGGYYCYLPIPYEESCKIVFCGKRIQFHQIQYRTFENNQSVTSFPFSWGVEEKEALKKACALWSSYSTRILDSVYKEGSLIVEEKESRVEPGEELDIFNNTEGGRIAGIELSPSEAFEGLYKDILIRAVWDDEATPAIYSPVADFFGFAYGKPSMQSLLAGKKDSYVYSYIPMPYDRDAKITIVYAKRENRNQIPVTIKSKVWYEKKKRNADREGKFYAQWRREKDAVKGKPYLFTELKGKGHYVGTILQAQGKKAEMTGFFEGDDSTVVDGVMRLHGTGSEDYFNGGWYAIPNRWDKGYSLPTHGALDYNIPFSRTGGFRFYFCDKIPFEKSLFTSIEHGPTRNQYDVDYTSLAFYYAAAPIESILTPVDSLREVFIPDGHFFHRDLMDFIIGDGTIVDHSRGYLSIQVQEGGYYTPGEGFIRISLEEVPKGEYELLVSYNDHNQGAEFSFWQRQTMVSPWLSSYNKDKTLANDKEFILDFNAGRITINDLLKDVTLKVRKSQYGGKFHYLSVTLKKVKK